MVVRIRLKKDPRFDGLFAGLASLLTLVAVACFILGAWKVFSELGWAGRFFLANGALSHWQVWLALAIVLQLLSFRLNRRFARNRIPTL
jgi:TRAP-type C4-dicarboxylate transport system permease small subunit